MLFPTLLALLSTAISYRFGIGNQQEHLPIFLRQIDPTYLANDVFVASTSEFGPRSYFASLVAAICEFVPLPWTYLLLRFASDFALVAVTLWAARRLLGAGRHAAMIAAVLTLFVSGFHLGDATELRYDLFASASLAIPGMLFAIGLGCLGRPVAAASVAAVSSLPHPIYGVHGAAVALLAAFAAVMLRLPATHPPRVEGLTSSLRAGLGSVGLGGVIFAGTFLLMWWWPLQRSGSEPLPTGELFEILARFRSPHHYLPSQFRPQDYLAAVLFAGVVGVAFERWTRTVDRRHAVVMLVPFGTALVVCLVGAVLSEAWPIGVVISMQPFRILSIVKWVGFLLIGWLLAEWLLRPAAASERPLAAMSLLSAGGAFPLIAAAAAAFTRYGNRLFGETAKVICLGALGLAAVLLFLYVPSASERVRLTAAVGLLALFWTDARPRRALGTVAAVSLLVLIARNRAEPPIVDFAPLRLAVSTSDLRDVRAETARAAAAHSTKDSVFIVPPDFAILRLVGERALVTDFEAVPFQGREMRAWRERIRVVYGDVEGGGFAALAALDARFRQSSDEHLRAVAARYGATHAVLYLDMKTALPVLYANGTYQVVALAP